MAIFLTPLAAAEGVAESMIPRVGLMPNLPQPYVLRDWRQVTRGYLDLAFDGAQRGTNLPLIAWKNDAGAKLSLPSYVGGPRDAEAINYLAAVVSGSLVGLDMRTYRDRDWVTLGSNFFNSTEGVYVNRLHGATGESFWYDVFPNVLSYQLVDLYPGDAARDNQAFRVAQRWYEACLALGAAVEPQALPNFNHTGLRLSTMRAVELGRIEPEGAAGIAWLEYMAWLKFKDPRFLTAADWTVRAIVERPAAESPLYEVLLPYGAIVAARMNAEDGRHYDVQKLVSDCFEPHGRPQARPGWGVIADRWNGSDVHGLVGSTTDGGGYAFAMNSFEWLGALAPLPRYDVRYAHDIGKWALNMANASRLFYADAHDALHQSSFDWSRAHDAQSTIAYEGIRKWQRGAATAVADGETRNGRRLAGSFDSTRFRKESPPQWEEFQETPHAARPFQHTWEFDLPSQKSRWLVVDARRIAGHRGNTFCFCYASQPQGPFTPAFAVAGVDAPHVVKLPNGLQGKLYVKVQSRDRSRSWHCPDRLCVDAMAISYQSDVGPYAQGDLVVTFVDLLNEATSPIVLYRPASAATDLGLYGSSHVGTLGGIIRPTNVEGILQLDLLKTDYFHSKAYPTYLYYNPHDAPQTVQIDVGSEPKDLYDATSDSFLAKNVKGVATFSMEPDAARVVVLAPAAGKIVHEPTRTLIDGVVVRYEH